MRITKEREIDDFKEIVKEYVDIFGTEHLTEYFEVADSTVRKWIKGTANPHPLVKSRIIEYITYKEE